MSEQKHVRNSRSVLQNVVCNAANQNTSDLESNEANVHESPSVSFNNYDRGCGKENRFDHDYSIINCKTISKRRYSASTDVFGEEPVFSDSDEEREYHRQIETQYLEMAPSEIPKKVNVAVQCNLTSDKMTLWNLIKECAKFDIENVNEEFQEVVLYCKQLQYKYEFNTPPVSMRREVSLNNYKVNEVSNEMQSFYKQPETMSNVKYSQSPSISKNFMPSRNSDDYTSEGCGFHVTYNMERLNPGNSGNSVNIDDGTNQSTRLQKSIKLTKIGKSRYKIVNGNQRTTAKWKCMRKDVPPARNNTSVKKPITASYDSYGEKEVKRKKLEVYSNLNKRPRRNKVKVKKLSPLEVAEELEGVRVKIKLTSRQIRKLARNWMKPHKSIFKPLALPVPLTDYDIRSSQQTHRVRRLYSPTEWLHSNYFNSLFESE